MHNIDFKLKKVNNSSIATFIPKIIKNDIFNDINKPHDKTELSPENAKAFFLTGQTYSILDKIHLAFMKQYEALAFNNKSFYNLINCVKRYSQNDYYEINRLLRGEAEILHPNSKSAKIQEKMEEYNRITISHIDELFEHSRINRNITVYRGVTKEAIQNITESIKATGIFQDAGYVSTSYKKDNARLFGDWMLEIDVQKESKAIDVASISNFPVLKEGESELILPRNSKFEITDFDKNRKTIKLKLVKG